MWKTEFSGAIFTIVLEMSERPVWVRPLGSCPVGPSLHPALN